MNTETFIGMIVIGVVAAVFEVLWMHARNKNARLKRELECAKEELECAKEELECAKEEVRLSEKELIEQKKLTELYRSCDELSDKRIEILEKRLVKAEAELRAEKEDAKFYMERAFELCDENTKLEAAILGQRYSNLIGIVF